jgi:hypothetical protein
MRCEETQAADCHCQRGLLFFKTFIKQTDYSPIHPFAGHTLMRACHKQPQGMHNTLEKLMNPVLPLASSNI